MMRGEADCILEPIDDGSREELLALRALPGGSRRALPRRGANLTRPTAGVMRLGGAVEAAHASAFLLCEEQV